MKNSVKKQEPLLGALGWSFPLVAMKHLALSACSSEVEPSISASWQEVLGPVMVDPPGQELVKGGKVCKSGLNQ